MSSVCIGHASTRTAQALLPTEVTKYIQFTLNTSPCVSTVLLFSQIQAETLGESSQKLRNAFGSQGLLPSQANSTQTPACSWQGHTSQVLRSSEYRSPPVPIRFTGTGLTALITQVHAEKVTFKTTLKLKPGVQSSGCSVHFA